MLKLFLIFLLLVGHCFGQTGGTEIDLLSSRITIPDTENGTWDLWRVAHADLDGDGVTERVEILARIEQVEKSESIRYRDFAWDDSHSWVARVIEVDGDTTWIYNRVLQMSKLEGYISSDNPPKIILTEIGRGTIGVYEVNYLGPDNLKTHLVIRSLFEGELRLRDRKNSDYWPKK